MITAEIVRFNKQLLLLFITVSRLIERAKLLFSTFLATNLTFDDSIHKNLKNISHNAIFKSF